MKKYSLLLFLSSIFLGSLFLSSTLCSCSSKKDVVYLADMAAVTEYEFTPDKEVIVQPNDLLQITVSCRRPELAIPFNTRNSSVAVKEDGEVYYQSGGTASNDNSYRVNKQGDIIFPVLGKIHVAGFRLTQISEIIREKIIEGDYIKDPQVAVDLLNFKYTVIGAVGQNGTFVADGDRVTLLEAIAKAGDIAPNGKTDNVKVIREVDGKRMMLEHDLTSFEIYDSPFFYLKPNDVVYVEPKYKNKDRENRRWQIASLCVSIASVITSLLWVITK